MRLWENAWAGVPFLQSDAETRRIVCTTNAIESANGDRQPSAALAQQERRGHALRG
ncbi:hypothetical protein ABZ619_23760 [Streptomyces sp. NPDC007851]|uniref:hypothetical protein n=1 Tax=Streptomyces sp. NPDC007851 TaxID=3155008 RepID=UPI0033D9E366